MAEDDKKNTLNQEDAALWHAYTREEVEKSQSVETDNMATLMEEGDQSYAIESERENIGTGDIESKKTQSTKISSADSQIDRRTSDKLKRGKMPIDKRLDLHGMTKVQAHEVLIQDLFLAREAGKRTVLVITGKGKAMATSDDWLKTGDGVLKKSVPQWLNEKPLRDIVLQVFPAQPQHGGSGALYVYLKRQR